MESGVVGYCSWIFNKPLLQELCAYLRIQFIEYFTFLTQTGDVTPRTRHYGPHPLFGQHEQVVLLRLVLDNVGIYLNELQVKLQEMFGVIVSPSTICRTLKKIGYSRRVIQDIAIQYSDQLRAKFMADITAFDPDMIIWIDESGCDKRNSTRGYAYIVIGQPPQDHRLLVQRTRYSAITSATVRGIHDVQLVEGSVNGNVFGEIVENTLVPILQPFNNVTRLILQTGALYFLPPYSPDLTLVELTFRK